MQVKETKGDSMKTIGKYFNTFLEVSKPVCFILALLFAVLAARRGQYAEAIYYLLFAKWCAELWRKDSNQ